jgi:flagellar motor switch protein FliG
MIKNKLVCIDSLRYLRDGQLLEVVLSLKHDELLQFLLGAPEEIRRTIFSKTPKDLAAELDEELAQANPVSREVYQALERKILNRMKLMSNEGLINLAETNERMFAEQGVPASASDEGQDGKGMNKDMKKVAGW